MWQERARTAIGSFGVVEFTDTTLPIVGCFEQEKKATFCAVFFDLATRLKELRKLHRLTQEACSERSGISYKYYQAIENGRKRDPRLSTLQKLAKAYDMHAWQLIAPTFSKKRLFRRTAKALKKSVDRCP